MAQRRYRRTERPQTRDRGPEIHVPDEREASERGRYGSFALYMALGLALATVAAIVAAAVFWPD